MRCTQTGLVARTRQVFARRENLASEGEQILVAAVGAVQASEAGTEIATLEERLNRGGGLRVQSREFIGVIVENLPDRRGAGLARAVADADHWVMGGLGALRRTIQQPLFCRWRCPRGAWKTV